MLFESALLFFANIVAVIMIFVVMLSRTVQQRLRLTLIATILSLVLWQDAIFLADNLATDLLLWNTAVFLWPTTAIASCFAFIRALHRSQTRQKQLSHLTVPMIAATLLQLLPIVTLQIFSSVTLTENGLELAREAGYYIYLAGLIASLILLVVEIIVRRATSLPKSLERYAINTVLATVVIASTYGFVINAVVPLLTGGQSLIGWGVLIIVIFAIGLGLSIARGRLLDIRFYAVRSTVYILSLATLAGVYAALVYPLSQWIFGYDASSAQNIVTVAMALVLAFIFQPVRVFFDKLTRKVFYRGEYDSDDFFADLNHILVSTTDLRPLLEKVSGHIARTLKSEQAFFALSMPEGRRIAAGTDRHAKLPAEDLRALTEYFSTHDRILRASQLTDNRALKRLLASHRIELVMALAHGDTPIGFLCLGEHLTSTYTARDLRVLKAVSDELVIAIQNAISVQEVKDLNASLEQRIDAATKELRASNAQLHRLDEAKDEFISMASHQLRTPLTSIKGYVSMLMEGDAGKVTPEQKHLLQEAFISSERMVRLIGDFLNVSRLQTGKFIVEKHPVDLAKLVAREIEALEPNASARGLKFSYRQPKKFPTLQLDENKIQQVIMNFADNAIYYSKDNATIKIGLKADTTGVEFTVTDKGIGVPESEQEHLFNKFFRATNARKQRPDGTGVGLFLAKKVIDAHGGRIIFESKEGRGSTFGFRLPLS